MILLKLLGDRICPRMDMKRGKGVNTIAENAAKTTSISRLVYGQETPMNH